MVVWGIIAKNKVKVSCHCDPNRVVLTPYQRLTDKINI